MQDNTKPADIQALERLIFSFSNKDDIEARLRILVACLRDRDHKEPHPKAFYTDIIERIFAEAGYVKAAPTVDTGELRKDFDFQQQRIWQLPTSTVLERQTVEFIYNWVAKQVAAAHQQGVLAGRIEENRYHWHHQKHIEQEAKTGISSYFLDRIAFLEAQAPTTEKGTE